VEFTMLVSLKDGLVSIGGLAVYLFLLSQHLLCLHLWSALSGLVSDFSFLVLISLNIETYSCVIYRNGYRLDDHVRKMTQTLDGYGMDESFHFIVCKLKKMVNKINKQLVGTHGYLELMLIWYT